MTAGDDSTQAGAVAGAGAGAVAGAVAGAGTAARGGDLTGQATVRDWRAGSGGSALRDDGTVVTLPPECLQDSAFRFLRSGQRVQLHVRDGFVIRVDLPGR